MLFFRELFFYPKTLFIHSATISKFESKNSQEYHAVCNGATNRPVEKGLLISTSEYFKKLKFQLLENTHKCKFVIFKLKEEDRVITY